MAPVARILIAEDEESFRRPLAELFRREGFECVCAEDAASAAQRLEEGEFDLLISDIHMPGNAGLEFIQRLPEVAAGLPVIVLTGRPTVETAALSVRLPVVAYLLKPPDFNELLALSRRAISNYRAWRAACSSRECLQRWTRDLEQIEMALRPRSDTRGSATSGDFVSLTLNNLLLALVDLKRVTDLMATAELNRSALQQANMVHALQRTIEVLERTRRNFKSTELRDLREEMERLVGSLNSGK
jgi:DNA-binding response OmpR family regulator